MLDDEIIFEEVKLSFTVYYTFKSIFSLVFTKMFDNPFQDRKLPKSMLLVTIKVIPKEQREPEIPSSYTPLSNQNTDSKILANILATHLNLVLPKFVATFQIGFVLNRQSRSTI